MPEDIYDVTQRWRAGFDLENYQPPKDTGLQELLAARNQCRDLLKQLDRAIQKAEAYNGSERDRLEREANDIAGDEAMYRHD